MALLIGRSIDAHDWKIARSIDIVVYVGGLKSSIDSVFTAEKSYDFQAGNSGFSILPKYIHRSTSVEVNTYRIREHAQPEAAVMACSDFSELRKVLPFEYIDPGLDLRGSRQERKHPDACHGENFH
jgi:hypothetical protein